MKFFKLSLQFTLLSLLFSLLYSAQALAFEPRVPVESFEEHSVLAQYHRWYLYYENDFYRMDNQISILDPGIIIRSSSEVVGHEAYRQGVQAFPKSWDNAHHVVKTEITKSGDTYYLEADIIYQNHGILPDVRTANLHYSTKLKASANGELPLFTEINIKQVEYTNIGDFKSAYPNNRVRSLLHNWLSLVEDPRQGSEKFRALLADKFSLFFPSTGKLNDDDGLKKWVASARLAVKSSSHKIRNFEVVTLNRNTYLMDADLDWHGITHSGDRIKMKTHHQWKIIDDPKDLFPKIVVLKVKIVEPISSEP